MTPAQFIAKWKKAELKERAACQEHFLDLCSVLGVETPAQADPEGNWFTFERSLTKEGGGKGFADVWRKNHFGWEYKGKRKDLSEALVQLQRYREALLNPPLLIVCDLDRFEIHTNFTNQVKRTHSFDLDGLADAKNLDKLRNAFLNPGAFHPDLTQQDVTKEVAASLTKVADLLRNHLTPTEKADPAAAHHRIAHFLMKCVFCMFAEDVELLPRNLFLNTLKKNKHDRKKLAKSLSMLFEAMAHKDGQFGEHSIAWFNGKLFDDAPVLELWPEDVRHLEDAAEQDWSNVDPSIFGTLFERLLDPDKRSQTGAHYTSRDDIETLLNPVLKAPLVREWDEVRAKADKAWEAAAGNRKSKAFKEFETIIEEFLFRLAHVTVLDPACGSGNFLYVALRMLLDLEKEVLTYAASRDQRNRFPTVRPTQLHGIEINPYAAELAQIVIWIGLLQWSKENGYLQEKEPILDAMETIENRDAILDLSDPENPKEPTWPDAEFIVGNPPFLGGKLMRSALSDEYMDKLYEVWSGRIPKAVDLCCYWFEKARACIKSSSTKRAGLLATQGIRGGRNREVLQRIKNSGDIFYAIRDRNWILDGANVHVSIIGFDNGDESTRVIDGNTVNIINPNLESSVNTTQAVRLSENMNACFRATEKGGSFELDDNVGWHLLQEPNPHRLPNSQVIVPWLNSEILLNERNYYWIIDYHYYDNERDCALYEKPFSYLKKRIIEQRTSNRDKRLIDKWWLFRRNAVDMRSAICDLGKFIGTPRVSKHRVFVWLEHPMLPDNMISVIASESQTVFGILHSRAHELWAIKQGTQLREKESGNRYTPTTCFETFPFPRPTKKQEATIAAAAKELDTLRNNWLNPPEWTRTETLEFPGSVDGPWKRYVTKPDKNGIGTVKYPRLVPEGPGEAEMLKARTLTKLYNERPAWLDNAHRTLDEAVFAAYGWSPGLSDDELLAKLLELNLERAAEERAASK